MASMCGRFSLTAGPEVLRDLFGVERLPPMRVRYNIAPTDEVLLVRAEPVTGLRVAELARFGLVPPGARDRRAGAKLINARQETVFQRAPFRDAARRRRALVAADGFFEWKKTERGRDPFWFRLKSGRPFGFGAIFERARLPDGSEVESCSVLTTTPNALVSPLHDRMPVIIAEDAFDLWLDPAVRAREPLEALLGPFPAEAMQAVPVSRRVNNVAHDDAECVAPLAPGQEASASSAVEPRSKARRRQLGFDFDG